MSKAAKYWEKYQIKQSHMKANLMTDKQAYITSLEAQLEKVTQSLLINQGFAERIEQLQSQLNTSEERIINLTRLVKLQQNYSENEQVLGNENSNEKLFQRLENLENKVSQIINKGNVKENKYSNFTQEVDKALNQTEKKIMVNPI